MDRSTFYGSKGLSGVAQWTPPFKSDILAGGDGTIILVGSDYYLKDKVSGKNLLITGYDFDSTWTKGIPYKSAATISAPAGDAAFIAADLNNFWYDSGGIPNQIPVVSCFQDIDYEHKTFFKHAAQVLDGNGVETYEPRVIEWAIYSDALTGADIVKANTYFVVPALAASYKVIDPVNGVDATGNGTFAAPYKTHSKVNGLTLTESILIYVKTGTIAPIAWSKNYQLKGIGRVKIQNVSGGRGIDYDPAGTLEQTIEGYWIDMVNKDAVNTAINATLLHTLNIKRLHITNSQSGASGTTYQNLTRVIENINTTDVLKGVNSNSNQIIKNCKITTSALGYGFYKDVNQTVSIEIINSKISAKYIGRAYYNCLIKITGGELTWTQSIFEISSTTGTLELNGVKCNTRAGIDLSDSPLTSVKYSACTFTATTNGGLSFQNQINVDVKNCIIRSTELGKSLINSAFHASNLANSIVNFESNRITVYDLGTPFTVGNESGSYYNKWSGNIHKNYVVHYDFEAHGLMVFNQNTGLQIRHNYCNGPNLCAGFKSAGGDDYTLSMLQGNIAINGHLLAKQVRNLKIYNNTCFADGTETNNKSIYIDNAGAAATGNDIKNNIIVSLKTGDYYMIEMGDANNTSDYNLFYCPNGTMKFHLAGVDKTFAQWQALGYDTHSKVLTDEEYAGLFVDPNNGDFSLKAGSVAIGAGVALDAAYDDCLDSLTNWGSESQSPVVVTKQQGAAWDCGAYIH